MHSDEFRHEDATLERAVVELMAAHATAVANGLEWHQVLAEASMRHAREEGGPAWLADILIAARGASHPFSDVGYLRGYYAGTPEGTRLARVSDQELGRALSAAVDTVDERMAELQDQVMDLVLDRAERERDR